MAVIKAKVSIQGKRPILFHHFSPSSIPLEKQEKTGVAGNDPEEWKRSVLKTKENQLYITSSYVFSCIKEGGLQIKAGRGTIMKKIASTLLVLEEIILLDRWVPSDLSFDNESSKDKTQPVYLDICSVRNPTTKGRNIRYRVAASARWKADFQIEWENSIVSRGEMEGAVKSAGLYAGLGDGRGIGFGRFDLISFQIDEANTKAK